ncbi:MAG TPA: cytochrome c biogenesis protein CcsA, partial [Lacipirellulaceae bacterium]|nr:cytochrome c biogenesis protein CcsA [Lacipirellulaceae bacterium]
VAEPRAQRKAKARAAETSSQVRWLPRLFPLLVVFVLGGWALSKARTPTAKEGEMDLFAAGKLPVMYQGRAKPLDTLARQSMVVMSNRQGFERPAEPGELSWIARLRGKETKSEPAIKWLLDVISGSEAAEAHRVIRIDSDDVLNTLDLQRRKGFMYSVGEIRKNYDEFKAEVDRAEKIPDEELGSYEKKLIEVNRRIGTYTLAVAAFRPFPMPTIPSEKEFKADPDATQRVLEQIRAIGQGLPRLHAELMRMEPPLAVPMPGSPLGWIAYSEAKDREFFQRLLPTFEPNEAVGHWDKILAAYERGDATAFNRAVDRYQAYLDQHGPSDLEAFVPGWEAFFNNFEPFYYAAFLYLFAFILSALAWLGWTGPLNRAAFWLLVFTFVFHTGSLILRMYISGRPPVTNLYSSAVFIGWGCVLFGLVFELIYRMGIGNTIAAIAGVATLAIAHLLMTHVPADRGDTMAVLRAVLDTQFWLATHVVCMTLGYATTFVAGLFGLVYIIRGVFTRSLTPELGKELTRMAYGTLCFAIFFSFVGTVLGGLWADDSWGRFWGWDPKENGALIIVLWNALVLHARWGGMVKDRGLALLSIGGNIVVGWSYFGVNELGI